MGLNETAKMAGISGSYLSNIEKGIKNNPSTETLQKIANVLGVSVKEFFKVDADSGKVESPLLTEKDNKDIARDLDAALKQLEKSQDGLMFDGEPLDDETRELLKISLENSMRLAKQIAKKYTPNKYKK